jgi:precorrin-6Y C5,15-methyltransferase (decarboxylating)
LLFLPHVSAVQLAFARIKEAWHDAAVVSLHGRPLESLLPVLASGESKIAVLTDAQNHPAIIAQLLLDVGQAEDFDLWVCEDLEAPAERVACWSPVELRDIQFSPLNVVVLLRRAARASRARWSLPLLGIPEATIPHRPGSSGLITKREVRLIALCHLELPAEGVLWDVGAGSGSLSLEAARLATSLQVFAVERAPEACQQLAKTVQSFGLANIRLVSGEAPTALASLPAPDAIFIGGSGGRLTEILVESVERLKVGGRMVLNCITLQSLARSWQWLSERGLQPEVTSVQIAHSQPLGSLDRLEPENPIFIVRTRKP